MVREVQKKRKEKKKSIKALQINDQLGTDPSLITNLILCIDKDL